MHKTVNSFVCIALSSHFVTSNHFSTVFLEYISFCLLVFNVGANPVPTSLFLVAFVLSTFRIRFLVLRDISFDIVMNLLSLINFRSFCYHFELILIESS